MYNYGVLFSSKNPLTNLELCNLVLKLKLEDSIYHLVTHIIDECKCFLCVMNMLKMSSILKQVYMCLHTGGEAMCHT